MDDDRHPPEPSMMLSEQQERILRKHLARQTLSLDDAAVLLGVRVDDLAAQFQGRRTAHDPRDAVYPGVDAEPRHARPSRGAASYRDRMADDSDDDRHEGLRAPQRQGYTPEPRGRAVWWVGGLFAGAVVIGGLALLSGIPQSLLFPPRGVSEFKDANAPAAANPEPSVGGPIADGVPVESAAAEPPAAAPPVDPMAANVEPGEVADPAADPALADPNAAAPPPADPSATVEAPVPAAPEEVPPAVAVGGDAGDPSALVAEAPPLSAPATSAPNATAPAPAIGPSTTLYATRGVSVRDAPTVTGSTVTAQLKRGASVSGVVTTGADGKSPWLQIESGPGAGGFVSIANMADTPRPAVVQAIGQQKTLIQAAALHAGPDATSATLDTLSPGIAVMAAAEVDGGWIEIQRRAGGVGYIRKEAFE